MKKSILPILLLIFMGFNSAITELTETERKFAVAELTKSQEQIINATKDLSEEQLNYKPDENTWSIAEIMEHLAVSEDMIFGMVQESLKVPADPSKREDVTMKDDEVLNLIEDRSHKVKTMEPMEPTGRFGSFEGSLEKFESKREAHIEYIKNTKDDLRNHYQKLPFGTVDAYQTILFIAGHSERHVKQLHEVMSDPEFPED